MNEPQTIRYPLATLLSPMAADLDPFLPELDTRFPNIHEPDYVREHFAGGTVEWCETEPSAVVLAAAHRAAGHQTFITQDAATDYPLCVLTAPHPAPQLAADTIDHLSIVVAELGHIITWASPQHLELDQFDTVFTSAAACLTYLAAMLVASTETELGHSTLIGHDPDSGEHLVYSTRPEPDWANDYRSVPVQPSSAMLDELWHTRQPTSRQQHIEPLLEEDGELGNWDHGTTWHCGPDPAAAFLWTIHETSSGSTATVMFDHTTDEYVVISTRPCPPPEPNPFRCRKHRPNTHHARNNI